MKEDKTTQSFLQAAYDVLSGNVKSFHQQAQEEYFEMWLNDDMELTEVQEQKLIDLRRVRNNLLNATDWRASTDLTMSDEWKTYRQELRDITKTYSSMDAEGFKWPTEPS